MIPVVVIGSNSFSGGDFIDYLLERNHYAVWGISRSKEKSALFLPYLSNANRSNYQFHRMDLNRDMERVKNLLSAVKPRYIVNFAAQSEVAPSWEHPGHWFQTNGVAVAELSSFLRDKPWLERYVHISSPEVYGTCEGVVTEDAPLNPSTPYAASKAAGDLMLFTLVKNFNFPLILIRSTNVYGAGQQLFKIIVRAVIYIKMGWTIELHGGGKAVKSYIHIRDVSRGEYLAMERGRPGEIYHFSPDHGISVFNVVKRICDKMGVDVAEATRVVDERTGQDKAYVIDSQKARVELSWKPEMSFDQGLDQVIGWVNENWETIKDESLEYRHQP